MLLKSEPKILALQGFKTNAFLLENNKVGLFVPATLYFFKMENIDFGAVGSRNSSPAGR